MKNKTLEYLIREPKKAIKNPPLIVLLHGYGSNETDLFSFAEELPDEFLIISPRAPLSLGYGSYAWYSIGFNEDGPNYSDIAEAKSALQQIDTFLQEIITEYEVDKNRIFLLGFSQGTILSTAYALNHPEKIQYVVALSGYVNEELLQNKVANNSYTNLDFFVSHGTVDQVIPVELARRTPGFLDAKGIKNVYQEYPVGHGVAPQNFFDLKKWLEERI
jgi:phospholipase/carboxylesterase